MLPADTHEMACSLLRPPKTTATRTRSPGDPACFGGESLPFTISRGYRVATFQVRRRNLSWAFAARPTGRAHSGLVLRPSSSAIASSTKSPL